MRKVCKTARETRGHGQFGLLRDAPRLGARVQLPSIVEKTTFFCKTYVFFTKHGPPVPRGRRLRKVALMMPLSMQVLSGISQFAFYKLSHFFVLSRCSSLRRDPRTSFFALFSEGFSDARVYRLHIQTHSGVFFFATTKK